MKNQAFHTFWLILPVCFLLSGCASKETEDEDVLSDEQKESAEVRPEVLFAVADGQPIYQYVESRGVVRPSKKIEIKPRISGFTQESNIRGGHWVTEGETLFTFQKQEWLYELQQAKNQYEKALAEYNITKKLRRSSKNFTGANGVDSTLSDKMVRIRTGLAEAEVTLKRAKLNLSYAVITAPFSGRLAAEQRYSQDSFVSAGTTLGILVNDAAVRVHFDVLEAEVNKIKEGMAVDVFAPNGQIMQGTVIAVSPVVDTESKTGEVIVRVNNGSQLLRAGMTVNGRIQIQKQTGQARIPRAAILSRAGGRTLLFKLHPGNNEVQWIYVDPIAVNSEWALIDHPEVAPGDTIAVDNHFALSHLQIVEPKMMLLQREEAVIGEL